MTKIHKYTKNEENVIINNYGKLGAAELSKMLGIPKRSLTNKVKRLRDKGLISQKAADQQRRKSYFVKGHTPANKGKKITDYMSEEAVKKVKLSTFKKGHVPGNTLYNGAVVIRNQNNNQYAYIRVACGKWEPLHRFRWKRVNGEIPKGYIVVFADGNTMNCAIENLELISRKENALRNQNAKKAAEKMRENYRKFKDLENDAYIVKLVTRDEELRKILIKNKDFIQLKRMQLKLRRVTNYELT